MASVSALGVAGATRLRLGSRPSRMARMAAAIIATAFAITRFVVQPWLGGPPSKPPASSPGSKPVVNPIGPTSSAGSAGGAGSVRLAHITEAVTEPITEPDAPLAQGGASGAQGALDALDEPARGAPPPGAVAEPGASDPSIAGAGPGPTRADDDATNAMSTGWLSVRTTPSAEVYLGSRFLGQTPTADIELTAGTHQLTFKQAGRPPVSRKISIRPDEKLSLNVDL